MAVSHFSVGKEVKGECIFTLLQLCRSLQARGDGDHFRLDLMWDADCFDLMLSNEIQTRARTRSSDFWCPRLNLFGKKYWGVRTNNWETLERRKPCIGFAVASQQKHSVWKSLKKSHFATLLLRLPSKKPLGWQFICDFYGGLQTLWCMNPRCICQVSLGFLCILRC